MTAFGQRLVRASATIARVPCVDGLPWPKYRVQASNSSILDSDSYAWLVEVLATSGRDVRAGLSGDDVDVVDGVSDEQPAPGARP